MKLKNIATAVLATGLLAGMPALAHAQSMEEAFKAADADGDGALAITEYQIYVDALAASGDEKSTMVKDTGDYANSFATLDADGNGTISMEELAAG